MTTPDTKSRAACGSARTELAKNDGVRITRCACGTIHLQMTRTGVTLQLTEAAFAELARATGEALQDLESAAHSGSGSASSTCMN
jgi:hypothetical protein